MSFYCFLLMCNDLSLGQAFFAAMMGGSSGMVEARESEVKSSGHCYS